jgi:hypothetical protein
MRFLPAPDRLLAEMRGLFSRRYATKQVLDLLPRGLKPPGYLLPSLRDEGLIGPAMQNDECFMQSWKQRLE